MSYFFQLFSTGAPGVGSVAYYPLDQERSEENNETSDPKKSETEDAERSKYQNIALLPVNKILTESHFCHVSFHIKGHYDLKSLLQCQSVFAERVLLLEKGTKEQEAKGQGTWNWSHFSRRTNASSESWKKELFLET